MDTERHHRGADIAGPEEAASTRELIDAVRGRGRRIDSLDAAHELGRRRPRRWAEVLGEVVREPDRPTDLRAAVAVELGREQAPENVTALAAALDADAPAVTRRAAEALGRIGDASALERLASLPDMKGAAGASVDFARTLIGYRLGLDEHRLAAPRRDAAVAVTADRGAAIEVEPLETSDVEALIEALRPEVPAIPLSPHGAVVLACDDDARFLVLFTEQAHQGQALEQLTRRSGVLAAVFEWSASLSRYDLSEYLLTHPESDERLRLFGVRPTGALVHVGEIQIDGATAAFTVRGLDRPHSLAVTIDGTIDRAAREVSFSQALADLDAPAQRQPGLRLTEPQA